jgi:CheY-like chemotaxis protein
VRILIIDDYRESAQANKLLLEAVGHEAIVASDGAAGIETARTAPPDAVLLDLYMPGVDGFETCRRLRALPALRSTVIIALTGACEEETRRRAHQAGFDLVMAKPVSLVDIQQTIEALAARRSAE